MPGLCRGAARRPPEGLDTVGWTADNELVKQPILPFDRPNPWGRRHGPARCQVALCRLADPAHRFSSLVGLADTVFARRR